MTLYTNGSLTPLTAPFKFAKPSGFDLWTASHESINTTITNLSTGFSEVQQLVYGNKNFGAFTCDAWSPGSPYGRFGICISGSNQTHFNAFPFYSAYNVSGSDLCVLSNQRYSDTSCTTSRFLVLYYR